MPHIALSPEVLAALAALLPLVTALVTHKLASGRVKAVVLLVLTAVASSVDQFAKGGGDLDQLVWTAFVLFLSSVGVHFGLLKPLGLTGSDGVVQRAVPGGVGGS